jgi:phage major head subunit gpT-like protein
MFFDEDTQKNKDDDLLNALFNVKKSDRFAEKAGTFGSLGNFAEKTEGQDASQDEFEQGFFNLLQHSTFSKDVIMSREWAEDAQVEMMAQRAKAMVRSYKRSRAQFASALLTGGDGESITYEGKTYSTKGGDNKSVFAPDHPLKTASTLSGSSSITETQSNVFTNKIGSGSTAAVLLNRYANIMRNFKDDRGHVIGLLADTIVIPGNAYQLEDTIKKIIGSDGETGTNNNDINTQRGKWTLVVDHLWTPEVTQANMPCIIMSSEANKDILGSTFWNRVELDIKSEIKTSSRNLLYNGYARWSAGFYNWRHVIMAGSSAVGATTLT